jgi:hypothetical protein
VQRQRQLLQRMVYCFLLISEKILGKKEAVEWTKEHFKSQQKGKLEKMKNPILINFYPKTFYISQCSWCTKYTKG